MTTTPPVTPWTETRCVTARCTGCGERAGDPDSGGIVHFDSASQARTDLTSDYGWRVTSDGTGERWLCRDCAEKQDCQRHGHDTVTLPETTMPDGSVIGPSSHCRRCGESLSRTGRTPPPEGYPAPEPRRVDLYWDHAALPEGQELAEAAAVLLRQASESGKVARWAAYHHDHPGAPLPDRSIEVDPAAGIRAAQKLVAAAQRLRDQLQQHLDPHTSVRLDRATSRPDQPRPDAPTQEQ